MALMTGVNVAARPGRIGTLGSFAVDAGRFGDAVRVVLAAVDRHHHDWPYAPAGLLEYLDAGGPVIPAAPARRRATPLRPPRRRERAGSTSLRSCRLKPLLGE